MSWPHAASKDSMRRRAPASQYIVAFNTRDTGIFQVLATAHTVKDHAHALNSNLRPRMLVQAVKHHEAAPTAMVSDGALFGRERL